MFRIDWIQHPVGHGGFHSGEVWEGNHNIFNWVFDCGSQQVGKFQRYLKSWAVTHRGPIDWLFISHFDADHVNGLDTLMARAVVRHVMVPYVNERELLYLVLREIGRGNLDRAFFELVADPASFFLSRGAESVTFLNGGRLRDGPRDPEAPPKKDPDGLCTTISPEPQTLRPRIRRVGQTADARVREIDASSCDVAITKGAFGLRLKPYRAPIAATDKKDLLRALLKLIGSVPRIRLRPGLGGLAFAIARHARTDLGRRQLRSIFKAHAGSSNRSSLSLMSIPVTDELKDTDWWVSHSYFHPGGEGAPGWMNTGDAELLKAIDLDDWKACYALDLPSVRVLALPHHGSDKNSDKGLQDLCRSAVLPVHVRSAASKHPGPNVMAAAGWRLQPVTEQKTSLFRMKFCQS